MLTLTQPADEVPCNQHSDQRGRITPAVRSGGSVVEYLTSSSSVDTDGRGDEGVRGSIPRQSIEFFLAISSWLSYDAFQCSFWPFLFGVSAIQSAAVHKPL